MLVVVAGVLAVGVAVVVFSLVTRWRRAWRLSGVVHTSVVDRRLESCRRRTRALDKRAARARRRGEGVSNL